MTQASKRKRFLSKQFKAINLVKYCDCGAKIKGHHHYLCNECWNKKYTMQGSKVIIK